MVLLGLFLALDRNEWFVAFTFGVLVDLDHAFAVERYVNDNGLAALLNATWDDGSGHPWKSLMHYPVGAFIVAPLAIGWRFLLPLLFWGSHIGLDYLQTATLSHSAIVESVLLSAIAAGIFAIQFKRWRHDRPEGDLIGYFRHISSSIRTSLSSLKSAAHQRGGTI